MNEIKTKAIDEKRMSNLKRDLIELRNDTYCIVDVKYEDYTIVIKGLLFDLSKWHCLYVSPSGKDCLSLEY